MQAYTVVLFDPSASPAECPESPGSVGLAVAPARRPPRWICMSTLPDWFRY